MTRFIKSGCERRGMRKLIAVLFVIVVLGVCVNASSIFLSGYLEEGRTTVYETEDGVYVISLLSVSDTKEKAVFKLNDEISKGMEEGDSHVFEDGSEIVVREMDITESGEGKDQAYYYFYGTGKDVLKLRNVSKYVLDARLCNFDGECVNEGSEDCCYDCGCGEGFRCENNECIEVEEKVEGKEEVVVEEKEKKTGFLKIALYVAMVIVMVKVFILLVWYVIRGKNKIF